MTGKSPFGLNMNPAREASESFDEYRARQKKVKAAIKSRLAGRPIHISCVVREEYGPAGTVEKRWIEQVGGSYRNPKRDPLRNSLPKAGKEAMRKKRTEGKLFEQAVAELGGPDALVGLLAEAAIEALEDAA